MDRGAVPDRSRAPLWLRKTRGSASIPANDTRRLASAEASGRRAVELVREDLRPAQILTRQAKSQVEAELAAAEAQPEAAE